MNNSISMMIPKDPEFIKYIWKQPVEIEITDKDVEIHTYSLIKILDGLTKLTKNKVLEQINELTKGSKNA